MNPDNYISATGLNTAPTDLDMRLDEAARMARHYLSNTYDEVRAADPIILSDDVAIRLMGARLSPAEPRLRLDDVDSRHLPKLDELPISPGFIVFPKDLVVARSSLDPEHEFVAIAALHYAPSILMTQGEDELGLVIHAFMDPTLCSWDLGVPRDQYASLVFRPWVWNQNVKQYLARRRIREDDNRLDPGWVIVWGVRMLIHLWDFMQQRIDCVHKPEPDRRQRRMATRLSLEPRIQVVQWRKEEHRHPDSYESESIDWKYRWPVKQHTRTYHRGTSEEFTIVIDKYIKGPPDKPLKAENITVNLVNR